MKEKEQLPGWPRGLSRKLAASYTRSEKDFARFLKALLNSAGPDTRWDVVCDNLNIHLSESVVRLVARHCG
jgi:hypothetical protein